MAAGLGQADQNVQVITTFKIVLATNTTIGSMSAGLGLAGQNVQVKTTLKNRLHIFPKAKTKLYQQVMQINHLEMQSLTFWMVLRFAKEKNMFIFLYFYHS